MHTVYSFLTDALPYIISAYDAGFYTIFPNEAFRNFIKNQI